MSAAHQVEPSIALIVDVVAEVTGVPARDIVSHRRHRPAARARQIVYWLAPKCTTATWPQVAAELGGRNHTTVQGGGRRAEAAFAADAELAAQANTALDALTALAAAGVSPPRPDVTAIARRIVGASRPERAAIGASTRDVVALAERLVALDAIAEAAATLITARDAAPAAPTNAEQEAAATLTGGLALLGYVTLQEDDNEQ